MVRLFRRIAFTVLLSLVLSGALSLLLSRVIVRRHQHSLVEHLSRHGLSLVVHELAKIPPEQRPARLRELSQFVNFPLRIVPVSSLAEPLPPHPQSFSVIAHSRFGPPTTAFRLDQTEALLVDPPPPGLRGGPRRKPPLLPYDAPVVGFLLFASLLTSILVSVPLIRRLRWIERAIIGLSKGNFEAKIEGPKDDALGAVAVALEQSAERLKRMFQERTELLQAVSHEFGTPLSRMRFQLELLSKAQNSNEQQKHLKALDAEITELDELSSELVHWMEADAARLSPQSFSLVPILEELIELEKSASPRDIEVQLQADAALQLVAERRQFSRAIENLVRNALRYAHTHVLVEVQETAEGIYVSVHDDGPGIPPEQRERVLQPFVRLEKSRSREQGGTGLGLAIVRRIVERHQGKIELLDSREGGIEVRTFWPKP